MYNQKNVTIKTEIKKQGVYLQTQISQVASFPSSSADADIGIETLPATCSLSQISLTPPPPQSPTMKAYPYYRDLFLYARVTFYQTSDEHTRIFSYELQISTAALF